MNTGFKIKKILLFSAFAGFFFALFSAGRVYAFSDKDRVMTIEDYLMDGTAVYDRDLKGLFDVQEEEDTEESDEETEAEKNTADSEKTSEKGAKGAKKSDWNLILVNKQKPVPDGYDAELASLNDSMQVDKRITGPVARLLGAAAEDGIELMICSAYRSYDRQTVLFNNKMDKLMKSGMSYFDAFKTASFSVTVPGTSEHQLGLALDIITPDYTDLDSGFADTEAGKWLKKNAPDYGFILRYPKGKEYITGIIFEPWHFRYVGKENAKYITERGLVLEEYIELLSE
ncbi:MAG: M15 family metallopeptidase [Lachnospiraceae bacterium]|nr:M15 family metallopeptidase [Lachnospiraceae bacterium]